MLLIDSLTSASTKDIFSFYIDPTLEKAQQKQNEQLNQIIQNIFEENIEISQIQEKKEELIRKNEALMQAKEQKRLEEDQAHQVELDKIWEGESKTHKLLTIGQEKQQENKEIQQAQAKIDEEQNQVIEDLGEQVVEFSQKLETDQVELKECKKQKIDLIKELDDLDKIEKDKRKQLEEKNQYTSFFVYLHQPLNYCLTKIQQRKEEFVKGIQFCSNWIGQWSLSDYVWSKLEAVSFHPITLVVLAILACVNPIAAAVFGALVIYMLIKKVYVLANMYFPTAMQKLQNI